MLIDTSVWVQHFARGEPGMDEAVEAEIVHTHELVLGELALGSMARRERTLGLLRALPTLPNATHGEVMALVDRHRLWGAGLGIVDAHLLASCLMAGERLWTRDKALLDAARRVGVRLHTPGGAP